MTLMMNNKVTFNKLDWNHRPSSNRSGKTYFQIMMFKLRELDRIIYPKFKMKEKNKKYLTVWNLSK